MIDVTHLSNIHYLTLFIYMIMTRSLNNFKFQLSMFFSTYSSFRLKNKQATFFYSFKK